MVAAMAQLHLSPPETFNFRNPEEWPKWKRRFVRGYARKYVTGSKYIATVAIRHL